jgi:hypothetical protein
MGPESGIYSLGAAGRIEGISDVSQGRGLDVKPYVIGNFRDVTSTQASTYKGNTGIDFLYSVTPQLKANLTINTDFAQTEVDDRQVNLTRFPLFFPEKRDFFLEGSGNFDFSREASNDLTAFFTRRIGITAAGQPQKVDYGAKLGGQIGRYKRRRHAGADGSAARRPWRGLSRRASQAAVSSASRTSARFTHGDRRATPRSMIASRSEPTSSFRPHGFAETRPSSSPASS